MPLSEFEASAGNWREQLRRNTVRTRLVIGSFIALYITVGLIADLFIVQSKYPQASLGQCFHALITFQILPYVTLLMGAIAGFSLLITYRFYDKLMLLGTQYHEITAETAKSLEEKQLYHVLEEMRLAAGLRFMPKVYIIDADYMNAFASGYSEKSAMVAITRGLMSQLSRDELQAVIAHELSHIRHQDIKLTLMVAILSNLLLMVMDIMFYSVLFNRDSQRGDNRLVMIVMVLRYVLPLLTLVLALFLSRTREYMADAGAVELMRDNEPLARALIKISDDHRVHAEVYNQQYANTAHEQVRQSSYLFDPSSLSGFESMSFLNTMFSTHPALQARLDALGFKKK